ncbi:MAG TPA: aminotransferase class III-fold pyridoxal phosphate-dependent enzyme [Polyangiaceae bacterium]|jgi:acetylornithine/N-succinyldiaminopimelate aminotransferase|nr:aminotransferase class III-fold pyridoxal phosphate-dependent enzyme [Polyangiaceae bacterium]
MHSEPTAHLMNLVAKPDAVMVRGKGVYIWDDSGKRYLDFVQGWAVNALGHCPPELSIALARQATELVSASPAYHNATALALGQRLAEVSGLPKVFLASTGAEANEGAIKLARKWGKVHRGGAFEIITTLNAFHGRTLATMAATGKPGWDAMFPPAMPGFVKVPYGDVAAVEAAIGANTAAVLVEPIQGEAGVVVPSDGYLRALRELADAHAILLMVDEVQTGVGRTGTLFAHQHDGVVPDVMTLGKGLGGGVPLAALLAAERASCFEKGEQGGTFVGNAFTAAAGLAVLDAVTAPGFLDAVVARGAQLVAGLRALDASIVEVRGRGLLVAARLDAARAERVRDAAFGLGLLVNAVRPDTLRFMPPLNVTGAELDEMLALLAKALAAA